MAAAGEAASRPTTGPGPPSPSTPRARHPRSRATRRTRRSSQAAGRGHRHRRAPALPRRRLPVLASDRRDPAAGPRGGRARVHAVRVVHPGPHPDRADPAEAQAERDPQDRASAANRAARRAILVPQASIRPSPGSLRKNGPPLGGLSRTGRVRPVTAGRRAARAAEQVGRASGVVPRCRATNGRRRPRAASDERTREETPMPYPKASPEQRTDRACPPARRFPALERSVLALLGRRQDLPGAHRRARRPARTAPTSSSSTTGRRSPTGCRTTATCSPATSRTSSRATRRCAGRRVERRFGWDCHGLPAEVEAEKQLGITHKAEIVGDGRREVQRRLPRPRCCATPRSGSATSPGRPAGSTSTTTTRPSTWTTWSSVMWAFKTLWDKGLIYEGFRVLCVLLALRDAAVATPRPGWTTSTGTGRTRRVTVGLRLSPATRARRRRARWSGRRRRGRCRPTWRAAVDPDIEYVVVETPDRPAVPAGRGAGRPRTRASSARSRAVLAHVHRRASWSGTRYTPLFDFFAGRQPTRTRCSPPTTSPPRTAPASCTSRRPSARRTRSSPTRPASSRSTRWTSQRRFTAQVPPYEGMQVFEANKPIIRDLKDAGRAAAAGDLRRTRTRTAGAATPR